MAGGGPTPRTPSAPAAARGSSRRDAGAHTRGCARRAARRGPGRGRGRPGGAGGGVSEPEGGRAVRRPHAAVRAACRLRSPRISAQWRSASRRCGGSSHRSHLPRAARVTREARSAEQIRGFGRIARQGSRPAGARAGGPCCPWGARRARGGPAGPLGRQTPPVAAHCLPSSERAGRSLAQRKKVSRQWPVTLVQVRPWRVA